MAELGLEGSKAHGDFALTLVFFEGSRLRIAIDAYGVTTWDQKIVTLSEITSRLKAEASPGETRVLIAADAESRHRQVLAVLNAVRDAGIEKVSFESKNPHP